MKTVNASLNQITKYLQHEDNLAFRLQVEMGSHSKCVEAVFL